MTTPTLSICIPSYNRANELRTALTNIHTQLENDLSLSDKIEVVVSDNASTDNTKEVVDSFLTKIKNLSYVRNDSNIGFDKNVLNVVAHSNGEYCLTLGDDDGIIDGGINAILETITETKSSYINLNHWGYNHALTAPFTPEPNRIQTDDITYNTLREFVTTIKAPMALVGSFGGMSVQLFKRQIWFNFEGKEKFIGTQAIHLFLILSAFKEEKSTLMKTPTIMSRNSNVRWDCFPGLETEKKRTQKTIETAIWISTLYGSFMNPYKIKVSLILRGISNTLKVYIKIILHFFGLLKSQ